MAMVRVERKGRIYLALGVRDGPHTLANRRPAMRFLTSRADEPGRYLELAAPLAPM
jgi:hypothetical protein